MSSISQILVKTARKSLENDNVPAESDKKIPFYKRPSLIESKEEEKISNQSLLDVQKRKQEDSELQNFIEYLIKLDITKEIPLKNKKLLEPTNFKEIHLENNKLHDHEFEQFLNEEEEEEKNPDFLDEIERICNSNQENEIEKEKENEEKIQKNKESNQPISLDYNNSIETPDEPIPKIDKNQFEKISECLNREKKNDCVSHMALMVANYLNGGNESLEQDKDLFDEIKQKISSYNEMFGDSSNRELMKNQSADTKQNQFILKENQISGMEPTKQQIIKILTKVFHDQNTDLTISDKENQHLKEFYDCLFQPNQAHIQLVFNESLMPCSFVEFVKNSEYKSIYMQFFRILIHETTGIPIQNIFFLKFSYGSLKIDYQISKFDESDPYEKLQFMKEQLRETISKLFPNDFVNLDVKLISFLNKLSLSALDFDARGDIKFPQKNGDDSLIRGTHKYYQPNSRWRRYGLSVKKLYEDDLWLGCDRNSKEWAVAFHGPKSSNDNIIKAIIDGREIKKGKNNVYGGQRTGTPRKRIIPKEGIYFSWDVESSYIKTIDLDGKKIEIAFQCRVDPNHCFQTERKDWLVVSDSKYVRPYGIVVRGLN